MLKSRGTTVGPVGELGTRRGTIGTGGREKGAARRDPARPPDRLKGSEEGEEGGPAFQRGAGQSAAHLRVRLNHGASDINPISSSFSDSLRPEPLARSSVLVSFARPLVRFSISLFFLFLSLSRSLDLVSQRHWFLFLSPFLSLFPPHLLSILSNCFFPTLVLFFFSRRCGVTACFVARNAWRPMAMCRSFFLSLFLFLTVPERVRHYCPFHFKQRFLSTLPVSPSTLSFDL